MQVNPGMQVMNGQPQQGYAPHGNQPQIAPPLRPAAPSPAPFQQYSHPPSSAGLPPPSGSVATVSVHLYLCNYYSL